MFSCESSLRSEGRDKTHHSYVILKGLDLKDQISGEKKNQSDPVNKWKSLELNFWNILGDFFSFATGNVYI